MNPTEIDTWIKEQLEIVTENGLDDWSLQGNGMQYDTASPRALRMVKVLREALKSRPHCACKDEKHFPSCWSLQVDKALAYTGDEE